MDKYKSNCICILGMHRSGTSTISRAFNLLGYYLGEDKDVINASPENPKGFWENYEIVCIHQELLHALNLDWDSDKVINKETLQSPLISPYRDKLKSFILNKLALHKQWMWKDPRTCILMPLWTEILKEICAAVVCVFVVRNPIDVAQSLVARNNFSTEKAYRLWLMHNLSALNNVLNVKTVFISYESFLKNWKIELKRSVGLLDIPWTGEEDNLFHKMNDFIDPSLQHNSTMVNLNSVPIHVRELYNYLVECTKSTNAVVQLPKSVKSMIIKYLSRY